MVVFFLHKLLTLKKPREKAPRSTSSKKWVIILDCHITVFFSKKRALFKILIFRFCWDTGYNTSYERYSLNYIVPGAIGAVVTILLKMDIDRINKNKITNMKFCVSFNKFCLIL